MPRKRKRVSSRPRDPVASFVAWLEYRPTPWRTWRAVLRADPCAYCGERRAQMELDHIVPLLRIRVPGTGRIRDAKALDVENRTGACRDCNREKCAASLLHFLLQRAGDGYLAPESRSYRIAHRPPVRSARAYWRTGCGACGEVIEVDDEIMLGPGRPAVHAGCWRPEMDAL